MSRPQGAVVLLCEPVLVAVFKFWRHRHQYEGAIHGTGVGQWVMQWCLDALGGESVFGENEYRRNVTSVTLSQADSSDVARCVSCICRFERLSYPNTVADTRPEPCLDAYTEDVKLSRARPVAEEGGVVVKCRLRCSMIKTIQPCYCERWCLSGPNDNCRTRSSAPDCTQKWRESSSYERLNTAG